MSDSLILSGHFYRMKLSYEAGDYVQMYLGQESNWLKVTDVDRDRLAFWIKDGGKHDTEPFTIHSGKVKLSFIKTDWGKSWYVQIKREGESLAFGLTECKTKLRNWMGNLAQPMCPPLIAVFRDVPPMMMVRHLFEGLGLAGQAADMEGGSGQRFQLLEVD